MNIEQKLLDRFTELCNTGQDLISHPIGKYGELDSVKMHKWGASCLHLLEKTFGNKNNHYAYFELQYRNKIDSTSYAEPALGILQSAKEDFEKELLFNTRSLIEAEVFEDFLEQAEYLKSKKYHIPAAVIAGFVLEDAIRRLCIKFSVHLNTPIDKAPFDEMNTALVKADVFNKTTQKLNLASYGIRTDAAHGKREPSKDEVVGMIQQIRHFLSSYYQA